MMETINEFLHSAGVWSAGSLWLPIAAWTLFAWPAYLLLRRVRGHPVVRYHLQRALLLSLPAGLAAVNIFDVQSWLEGMGTAGASSGGGAAVYVLLPTVESVQAGGGGSIIYVLLGLLTLAAGMLAVYQLMRLGGQAARLVSFFRRLRDERQVDLKRKVHRLAADMGLRRPIRLIVTDEDLSPMTFGYRRPTVVIPDRIAEDDDRLRMTLAHELAHIRRGDYLWHWLERLVDALLVIHPLVRKLRFEISALREMVCDAEVLQRVACSPKKYAVLLYETIVPATGETSFAVAMSEGGDHLKRRIKAMKQFNQIPDGFLSPQRLGLALGGLLLAAGVLLVSCTDLVGPSGPAADTQTSEQVATSQQRTDETSDPEVFVAVDQMPELQGGIQSLIDEVQYPEQAYEAGVEGQVIVHFIVDEQGNVVNPEVLRGIGAGCDEEALRVVKTAEFTPGRTADGQTVRVKMSLPVRFSLNGSSNSSAGSDASTAINLEILEDGSMQLNDQEVSLENLTIRLNHLVEGSETRVNVTVHGDASMGFVNDVQTRLRDSGAMRIAYTRG